MNVTMCSVNNIVYASVPSILCTLDKKILETVTGNILGDGSLRSGYSDGRFNPKARYAMSIKASSYDYMLHLKNDVYHSFHCSNLRPYPNVNLPHHQNKIVQHYNFDTRISVTLGTLHAI